MILGPHEPNKPETRIDEKSPGSLRAAPGIPNKSRIHVRIYVERTFGMQDLEYASCHAGRAWHQPATAPAQTPSDYAPPDQDQSARRPQVDVRRWRGDSSELPPRTQQIPNTQLVAALRESVAPAPLLRKSPPPPRRVASRPYGAREGLWLEKAQADLPARYRRLIPELDGRRLRMQR